MEYSVSVVVCTYNSDLYKLKQTLFSIIKQKKIKYEIIIADDGSEYFNKMAIEKYFINNNFMNYRILNHETNQGTVKNIRDAVSIATGKYIYAISPGDFLYNETVLFDLLSFVEEENISFCFGVPILYSKKNGELQFFSTVKPRIPGIYNIPFFKYRAQLISLFSGQNPIGATYFRKRDTFLKYLNEICDKVVYLEDKPTSALYLMDHNIMRYFNRPVVWYEADTGISNSSSSKWKELIMKDNYSMKELLLKRKEKMRIVQAFCSKSLKYIDIYCYSIIIRVIGKIRVRFAKKPFYNTEYILNILNNQD